MNNVLVMMQNGRDFPLFVKANESIVYFPEAEDFERLQPHYQWLIGDSMDDEMLIDCTAAHSLLRLCSKAASFNRDFLTCCLKSHLEDVANYNISDRGFYFAATLAGFTFRRFDDQERYLMNIVTDHAYFDLLEALKRGRRKVDRDLDESRRRRLVAEAQSSNHRWRDDDYVLSHYNRVISECPLGADVCNQCVENAISGTAGGMPAESVYLA